MEQQTIETFYEEARKRGITVGNIQQTERGIFVQFTPRKGNKEGLHRTFRTLEAFLAFALGILPYKNCKTSKNLEP